MKTAKDFVSFREMSEHWNGPANAWHVINKEISCLRKALDLALYYVEGDATYEGVKQKVNEILTGFQPVAKKE